MQDTHIYSEAAQSPQHNTPAEGLCWVSDKTRKQGFAIIWAHLYIAALNKQYAWDVF